MTADSASSQHPVRITILSSVTSDWRVVDQPNWNLEFRCDLVAEQVVGVKTRWPEDEGAAQIRIWAFEPWDVEAAASTSVVEDQRELAGSIVDELTDFQLSTPAIEHDALDPADLVIDAALKAASGVVAKELVSIVVQRVRLLLDRRAASNAEDWREEGGYL